VFFQLAFLCIALVFTPFQNANASTNTLLIPTTSLNVEPNSTTICTGSTVTASIQASQLNVRYQFYNGATASGSPVDGTGGLILITSGTVSSTVTLTIRATETFGAGISATLTETVAVTVVNTPPTANAGTNQIICGLTSVLNGNSPGAATGAWTQVSGPSTATFTNAAVRNSGVSVTASGTYVFRWTISNPPCPSSFSNVTIVFSAPPTAADAGQDQNACGLSTNLAGVAPTVGIASWFLVSGPGGAFFGDNTSPTSTITVFSAGTYVVQWTVFNGVCPLSTDQVTITFNDITNSPDAGVDQDFCGLSLALSGNDVSPQIGTWSQTGGPAVATFADVNAYNTIVSVPIEGSYTFQWEVVNPPCPIETSDVAINFSFHPELCNNLDDDCDGLYDEDFDLDFDGWTTCQGDCDDTNANIFPGNPEICDLLDNDCNTLIDDGVQLTFYRDLDGDSYGDNATSILACTAPVGYVADNTDCNDTNANINPGETEICNGFDDNCNIAIDEFVQTTFFADADGDTYGDPNVSFDACTAPVGYVLDNTDCDDTNAAVHPGGLEVCDGLDNNCDTQIDEGVQLTFYADNDGDVHGDPNNSILACSAPAGYVSNNTDCDDTNPAVYTGATEVCDGVDNDCDTQIDEGVLLTFYQDADGDTYGNNGVTTQACSAPVGYVSNHTDCNDTDASINPGATEVCDLVDNDCDTQIDEAVQSTFYVDADGDGFGNPAISTQACTAPAGYVSDNTDCDDTNNTVYAGAPEVCDGLDNDCDTQIDEGVLSTFYRDFDGDGYGNFAISTQACSAPVGYVVNNTDCNDNVATAYPGAPEICDGIDNDCNLVIDEGVQLTFYQDADGDSYGNASVTTLACTAPAGYVSDNTDCNDGNASAHPGATEICDGVDNNCNIAIDEGVLTTYYVDADGDGYGDATVSVTACSTPAGYVANSTDCDDSNTAVHPGVIEICNNIDDNCDSQIDEGVQQTFYADTDGDGFGNAASSIGACIAPAGYVINSTDCNDNNNTVYPGATEICDGLDNDCDTQVDEGVLTTFYLDADADGYGNHLISTTACSAPLGYVVNGTDCNDANSAINPGQTELCNGFDDNCNIAIDEGVLVTYYIDLDGDGYGNSSVFYAACFNPPGYVAVGGDCNDANSAINPGATEICDGIDNNCNTQIDEGVLITYYADADGDTYGNPAISQTACSQPAGYVTDNTDCNDANATVYPTAPELCDGLDNNCNTTIDEGVQTIFYLDNDGDGFGNPAISTSACTAPVGYVTDNTDCDDSNSAVNPSATEICDGIDNNCDTQIDEGVQSTFYADADGDGFGNPAVSQQACTAPVGYVADNTDCDDTNNSVYPGATELCDGLDNNCDTQIDEGVALTYYADADGDGYGDAGVSITSCSPVVGFVTDSTDCDDTDAAVNSGATEICDGIDNNCDTQIDEGVLVTFYIDADGDGYGDPTTMAQACSLPVGFVVAGGDCDDTDNAINPAATEICDGVDNNCDTQIDEGVSFTWYADNDSDGFGDDTNFLITCVQPVGYIAQNGDCDDTDNTINPLATEVCDGVDNNCDGNIDEGVSTIYYADTDGDGFGDPLNSLSACSLPVGYVLDNTDCDDTDNTINPLGTEVCDGFDNNCDGNIDEGVSTTYFADTDGDGFGDASNTTAACSQPLGYVSDNTDCDDTNSSINTSATEICDGIDNNCDTQIDEGVQSTFFADADGDGFGDAASTILACSAPVGYVSDNTDCDDTNSAINPSATEICDGLDNNCDTQIDEGVQTTFYGDADGDGFGDPFSTIQACSVPLGFVADNTDCLDFDDTVYPGAPELCDGLDNDCNLLIDDNAGPTWYADVDGDGYGDDNVSQNACTQPVGYVAANGDCNDADAAINPAAVEVCDGIDNNCNVQIDEGVLTSYYLDLDLDGFGDPASVLNACSQPVGYILDNSDCDDTDSAINPLATEVCDNVDNNCDGNIDEGVSTTYYADLDGDTFGDPTNTIAACSQPVGYVLDNTDCDDTNASINTNGTEICDGLDNNCDGNIDEGVQLTFYADTDGDGFGDAANTTLACSAPVGYTSDNTDCDDTNNTVYPGGTEICDLLDNNCDGNIDEGVQTTFYADADGDGFGDAASTTLACTAPAGFVSDNTDCNDGDNTVYPGATELCDGLDNDCNLLIDDNAGPTWYTDADGDGFGDTATAQNACTQPAGTVAVGGDCNDNNAAINPLAAEICDGIDNNCDTQIDEGVSIVYYADADGDGFGNPLVTTNSCAQPVGYVLDNTDCNDSNSAINSLATEVCDGVDNNCNTQIDEGVQSTFYQDADNDTFGNPSVTILACTQPAGYVSNSTDCNDSNAAINPNATEICDGVDNNCNTTIDEGVQLTFYADTDGDGFGNATSTTLACTAPVGYVANSTDCDDSNAAINPSAAEICDGLDNNCNTQIDEGVQTTFYADTDGDGYGDAATTTLACTAPAGYVADNTDCNDSDGAINPGATEICDGVDNNCNLAIDDNAGTIWYADVDLDGIGDLNTTAISCTQPTGYVAIGGDCNDNDATISPLAIELCDGIDNNCDTQIDEGVQTTYYADADGDGFGDPNVTQAACSQPLGYVLDNTDCDDTDATINTLGTEVCDNADNNCNTVIDEGVQTTFYADADGDGFGDAASTTLACTAPIGYVSDNTDCDDTNNTVYPGNAETCDGIDNNCNFTIDEGVLTLYYVDADGDGYGNPNISTLACSQPAGFVLDHTDCSDFIAAMNPGMTEICDGLDNDCDLNIDEDAGIAWYLDLDGDGYGDEATSLLACVQPLGYTALGGDCNDADITINPLGVEVCDSLDNNCDSNIDEGVGTVYYLDADADGYGDDLNTISACSQPTGYVGVGGDCDDTNILVNPAAAEVCNGIDDNCDLLIDDTGTDTYYFDADGDGFGDVNTAIATCIPPPGYVADGTDCNDNDLTINPLAIEVCDGIDNNCDTQIDEGAGTVYYLDLDADGFGDDNNQVMSCVDVPGYVTIGGDCDDSNSAVNPTATEVCNGIDDNCDTVIDEGGVIYYADADGDGFGDANTSQQSCTQPAGYVTDSTDCDDTNNAVNPAATEVCNNIDDNCNLQIDEGVQTTFYADADGDGYGSLTDFLLGCTAPTGYTAVTGDCNDADNTINPGVAEICNNIDDNCDTQIDEGLTTGDCADTDADGVKDGWDADDDNDGILDATEIATAQNSGDTDGDGIPDYLDLDSDGDGINDVIEAGGSDDDNDGMIGTSPIVDANGDGVSDNLPAGGLVPMDSDNDGAPDFQDTDSDDDTVLDSAENDANGDTAGPDDTDGDGTYDFEDTDDDGDGLLTADEWDFNHDGVGPDDCDGDGIPDYLDADHCNIFVPEGFSPNGDNQNEVFVIAFVPAGVTIEFHVFNRWGAEVYGNANYQNDWNGTGNTAGANGDLPSGTYFYRIKISDESSERVGYITLWR
jgi:gliding motility-associated-like protein